MLQNQADVEAARLDIEIGGRLRQARRAAGLTQTQLGDALGVSFQQVQKYERGTNRISSSALVILARLLGVSPTSLLGGGADAPGSSIDWNLFGVAGSDKLLEAYAAIATPALRKVVLDLSRRLAEDSAAA